MPGATTTGDTPRRHGNAPPLATPYQLEITLAPVIYSDDAPTWRKMMDRQQRERDHERDKAAALIQKLRGLRVYLSFSQEPLWPGHLDVLRDLSHSANLREARNMFPDTHSPTQRSASGH